MSTPIRPVFREISPRSSFLTPLPLYPTYPAPLSDAPTVEQPCDLCQFHSSRASPYRRVIAVVTYHGSETGGADGLFCLFGLFSWFGSKHEINQMNQTNKMNQTDQTGKISQMSYRK